MDKDLREFCQKVSYLIPHIHREVFRGGLGKMTTGNITFSQIIVLELLKERGSSIMKDIAKSLSVTTSAATGMVDRMVKTNLLRRKPKTDDRRVIIIELTKKGNDIIEKIRKEKEDMLLTIFGKLTKEERSEYLRILEKIYKNLKGKK